MTVAVAVKVYDGLVLAADSATTAELENGSHQVWNNANKIVQLHRSFPIAVMTWGTGSLGAASIEAIAKDFRARLSGDDPSSDDEPLTADYTIESVAQRFAEVIHDVHVNGVDEDDPVQTPGLAVAGYNGRNGSSELWVIDAADRDTVPAVQQVIGPNHHGWISFAQIDATRRLFLGWDPELPAALRARLTDEEWAKIEPVFTDGGFAVQPAPPYMPFMDAIKLARFLVDTTVGYSRFNLGPDTVGGPTEVAGITRHEGFKWVARKHYYSHELNPREYH